MLAKFPVIVGPTAGGKTGLSVRLAQRLEAEGRGPAEVVSADSMQVFRGMDVGTAKPTVAERGGVVHHLIDIIDPDEAFSVDRWLGLAESAIDGIRGRGGVPIVVGGTHLYAKALLEGLFEGPAADESLRAELGAMDASALRAELERVDPEAAGRIHPNDVRRTIRAIEVFRLTGEPISAQQRQWDAGRVRDDVLLVGLEWSSEGVNRRINERVRMMVKDGLFEEVAGLLASGRFGSQAREALGYKQAIPAVEGRMGREEAVERIKIETRRFAKNQRTWLRRLRAIPGSVWVRPEAQGWDEIVQTVVDRMLTAK